MRRATPDHRAYRALPVQALPGRKVKQAHKVCKVLLAQPVRRVHRVHKA